MCVFCYLSERMGRLGMSERYLTYKENDNEDLFCMKDFVWHNILLLHGIIINLFVTIK